MVVVRRAAPTCAGANAVEPELLEWWLCGSPSYDTTSCSYGSTPSSPSPQLPPPPIHPPIHPYLVLIHQQEAMALVQASGNVGILLWAANKLVYSDVHRG